MTLYESVKTSVTPRMAAERYGLEVQPNGMACCPFHPDRHPSMKLNPDYYYCFGCGSSGDVVDLTAKLLSISSAEAAQKLADDFALSNRSARAEPNRQRDLIDRERLCHRVLSDYLSILQRWKERYPPASPDDVPDPRFTEACHRLECIRYTMDLLAIGTRVERQKIVDDLMTDGRIHLLQEHLQSIREGEHV